LQIGTAGPRVNGKILCNQNRCIYIYPSMSEPFLPLLPCMCGSFRRTTRALTQLYENALRPLGLRATQLTILQALSRTGEISQRQLGEILAMDSTSLTRTLAIMRRQDWIAERRGGDRRERLLNLASAGEKKLARVLPAWEKVQAGLRRELGEQAWNSLLRLTHEVTRKLTTQGGLS
jgi:DNA-binding MarR family transcriptional regulator